MRTLLSVLLLVVAMAAQPVPECTDVGAVKVLNASRQSRRAVVTCVVPFARGVFRGGPLCIKGRRLEAVQLARLGAPWRDGSWRHARVSFRVRVGPRQAQSVHLCSGGVGAAPAFSFSEAVLAGIGGFGMALRVGQSTVRFSRWVAVEDGQVLRAWRARSRVPGTPVWAELTLEVGSGMEHGAFTLWYGTSDTSTPAVTHDIGDVALIVAGEVRVALRNAPSKLVAVEELAPNRVALRLMRAQAWGDGESQVVRGVVTFSHGAKDPSTLLAEIEVPVLACSEGWAASGAFGPWGYVPPPPSNWNQAASWARAVKDYSQFGDGDPWETGPLGAGLSPNQAGDQPHFGALRLVEEAHGHPARLLAVQRQIDTEAHRPVWLRDADGAPLLLNKQKPLPHVWVGQVFHRTTPNKLGKAAAPGTVHGFLGYDRQHWNIQPLPAYAMLTGDRLALAMIDQHVDLWLVSNRTDTGNATIDGFPATRALGRTLDTGTWLYLLTGRPDVAELLRHRCATTARLWVGRDSRPVRPIKVGDPDARKFQLLPVEERLQHRLWVGWEQGLGLRGFDAVATVLNSPAARMLVYESGRTLLNFGTWQRNDGRWVVADSVKWHDGGRALTADEIAAGLREPAGNGSLGFVDWCFPAFAALQREALARGDTATADLCEPVLAQQRSLPHSWKHAGWLAVR